MSYIHFLSKNTFYDKMNLRLFYFDVTILWFSSVHYQKLEKFNFLRNDSGQLAVYQLVLVTNSLFFFFNGCNSIINSPSFRVVSA